MVGRDRGGRSLPRPRRCGAPTPMPTAVAGDLRATRRRQPGRPRVGCVAFLDGDAYLRFMGRFSIPLTHGVRRLVRAPGRGHRPRRGLRARRAHRGAGPSLRRATVLAVDPSPAFVAAAREHVPGVEVQQGVGRAAPLRDDSVDAALAQLVVHFMADPVRGLSEMRRVTRPGGVVSACVWDHAGESGPLSVFWSAVRSQGDPVDGRVPARRGPRGAPRRAVRPGRLLRRSRRPDRRDGRVHVVRGLVGAVHDGGRPGRRPRRRLSTRRPRERLVAECRSRLPEPPFELTASAWAARAAVS